MLILFSFLLPIKPTKARGGRKHSDKLKQHRNQTNGAPQTRMARLSHAKAKSTPQKMRVRISDDTIAARGVILSKNRMRPTRNIGGKPASWFWRNEPESQSPNIANHADGTIANI